MRGRTNVGTAGDGDMNLNAKIQRYKVADGEKLVAGDFVKINPFFMENHIYTANSVDNPIWEKYNEDEIILAYTNSANASTAIIYNVNEKVIKKIYNFDIQNVTSIIVLQNKNVYVANASSAKLYNIDEAYNFKLLSSISLDYVPTDMGNTYYRTIMESINLKYDNDNIFCINILEYSTSTSVSSKKRAAVSFVINTNEDTLTRVEDFVVYGVRGGINKDIFKYSLSKDYNYTYRAFCAENGKIVLIYNNEEANSPSYLHLVTLSVNESEKKIQMHLETDINISETKNRNEYNIGSFCNILNNKCFFGVFIVKSGVIDSFLAYILNTDENTVEYNEILPANQYLLGAESKYAISSHTAYYVNGKIIQCLIDSNASGCRLKTFNYSNYMLTKGYIYDIPNKCPYFGISEWTDKTLMFIYDQDTSTIGYMEIFVDGEYINIIESKSTIERSNAYLVNGVAKENGMSGEIIDVYVPLDA